MIILDTNVLSELVRRAPSPQVMSWMASHPATSLFTTAVTQAEIFYGLELLPKGKRRSALLSATEAMFAEDFADRVLPFDADAARFFPNIAFSRRRLGRPIAQGDAQIAAIARSRGSSLATRNLADFEHCGISVVNPWESR